MLFLKRKSVAIATLLYSLINLNLFYSEIMMETLSTSPFIGGHSLIISTLHFDKDENLSFSFERIRCPTCSISFERIAISSLTIRFTST